MKKRILSILLTIFMLALTIAPMTAYAESGSSGSGAYGALLTPDTTPPPDGQRMKATHTAQKRVSPLPSPRGMSRSFTVTAMRRANPQRIIPRCMTS